MTDYPRCKTCKWWAARGRPADRLYMCDNLKVFEGDELDEADSVSGCFWAGPDFGCVHHEGRGELTE